MPVSNTRNPAAHTQDGMSGNQYLITSPTATSSAATVIAQLTSSSSPWRSEGRGHVACRVGLECAGDGQVRSHLAEGLHEEEHHDADEGVGEDCAAGACGGDGLTGGDEEAGADCAADCDHLHVAGGEASLQFTICGGWLPMQRRKSL